MEPQEYSSVGNLAQRTQWLLSRLPRVDPRTSAREPDYYGASFLVAENLGLSLPPLSQASWYHGWQPTKLWERAPHLDPRAVFGDRNPKGVNLVMTEPQAEFMRSHGWAKTTACGAPFLWAPDSNFARLEGSLLVMPPHVTDMTEQDWNEEQYVEQIKSVQKDFGEVVACVSGFCVAKGYWINSFERAEIPWIKGAWVKDRNALRRMRSIFDSFEFVTTPKLGSHIPYAAYAGCKVSVWGSDMPSKREYFKNDPMRRRYPEGLELALLEATRERLIERYPFLFCDPLSGQLLQDWAAAELGAERKLPALDMAELLGWRWNTSWNDLKTRHFLHSYSARIGKTLFEVEDRIRLWLRRKDI